MNTLLMFLSKIGLGLIGIKVLFDMILAIKGLKVSKEK